MLGKIVAVLLTVLAIKCQADHDECRQNNLVTFNAGLIPLVPLYETRKLRLAQAIRETNADVVCLQEVVYEEDMARILDYLKWDYPYSWSFLHSGTYTVIEALKSKYFGGWYKYLGEKPFPCLDPGLSAYQQCLIANCSSAGGAIALTLCLFHKCRDEVFALSGDCLSCLANSATTPQIAAAKCATAGPLRMRNRFQPEGVVVLSKKRIRSAKKIRYIPGIKQIYPRGLLEVDIRGIGKVGCTHLTSDLSDLNVPYIEVKLTETLGITNYVDQQAREIAKIKELYDNQAVILTGDFNTGPPVLSQNVNGKLPQHYDDLTAQGFDNPYVEQVGKCTYCNENPIAINTTSILDHVLLSGYDALGATRIFDDPSRPLSDHYGVSVSFCRSDD